MSAPTVGRGASGLSLSLLALLDPAQLADPYALHRRMREAAPVLWDPYLHAWVVTGYAEVAEVLSRFSAVTAPTPAALTELGLGDVAPIAEVWVRQMLFLDPPDHSRIRGLASCAFTARRIAHLRERVQVITDELIDGFADDGEADLMARFAAPLPAIVTADMLGVPRADHELLKTWSAAFSETLGNFQPNPARLPEIRAQLDQMTAYFRAAVRAEATHPTTGLVNALVTAEVDGDRLDEDDVIANLIITMTGAQETTTNLIGSGVVALLRRPEAWALLRDDPGVITSAVEELLRFEPPSQHTARKVGEDTELGGQALAAGDTVIAVMAAANRDPARFPDPDRLDLRRADNRHLAFGWANHFCFGAPLARMEAAAAFGTLARRLPDLAVTTDALRWRSNLGLRGLVELPVRFGA